MNHSSGLIIAAAGNSEGEETFWIQMLVLVILASLIGLGGIIKAGANRSDDRKQNYKALKKLKDKCLGIFSKAAQPEHIIKEHLFGFDGQTIAGEAEPKDKSAGEKDLAGGMEMLKVDFLLSVVENTRGSDKNDVTMRELAFGELLRREQLKSADSNALKVYAINKGNLYDKNIQCEAMKELTARGGIRSPMRAPVVKKRSVKGRPVRI